MEVDSQTVKSFLMKYDIWDEGMSDNEALERYNKFCDVKFGCAPPERWP